MNVSDSHALAPTFNSVHLFAKEAAQIKRLTFLSPTSFYARVLKFK